MARDGLVEIAGAISGAEELPEGLEEGGLRASKDKGSAPTTVALGKGVAEGAATEAAVDSPWEVEDVDEEAVVGRATRRTMGVDRRGVRLIVVSRGERTGVEDSAEITGSCTEGSLLSTLLSDSSSISSASGTLRISSSSESWSVKRELLLLRAR